MDTPIVDFVRQYADEKALRLHMPGHKGQVLLGPEPLDITEIDGADSLYEAEGIIARSEENASRLFGCATLYSTEGSSQCIRAMVHLALLHGRQQHRRPVIAAARNVHKTFLSAAALLDAEVIWLSSAAGGSYLSCKPDEAALERVLQEQRPSAVYVTSPDYLGQLCSIDRLAALCHRYDTLLLVDNAHGAYLRFLPESLHPMDLGADLCCDSAHKTLPVLTGGAYLHLSAQFSKELGKTALSLFGSTSPSYLILQSLDQANAYLETYPNKLSQFLPQANSLKRRLAAAGYTLLEEEPLKVTVSASDYGYDGRELAECLRRQGVVCEFADRDHLVLMLTPEIGQSGLDRLEKALTAIPAKPAVSADAPAIPAIKQVMSIREAMLSPCEMLPIGQAAGRILAAASVGCPPAVPIAVCGERITEETVACFRYYGVERCAVVKE